MHMTAYERFDFGVPVVVAIFILVLLVSYFRKRLKVEKAVLSVFEKDGVEWLRRREIRKALEAEGVTLSLSRVSRVCKRLCYEGKLRQKPYVVECGRSEAANYFALPEKQKQLKEQEGKRRGRLAA